MARGGVNTISADETGSRSSGPVFENGGGRGQMVFDGRQPLAQAKRTVAESIEQDAMEFGALNGDDGESKLFAHRRQAGGTDSVQSSRATRSTSAPASMMG